MGKLERGAVRGTLGNVFLPFACGYFFSFMLRNINAVAFPEVVREFGLGPDALGVLTSAYFLGFALLQLPLGLLLDRYGPRRVNASLLLVAAAGTLLFAAGTSLAHLTAGRALMGMGFAGGLMASMAAFVLWFARSRMATLSGWMIAVGACGAIAGTAPAEIALRVLDWRALFFVLAGFVVGASALIWSRVPERQSTAPVRGWRSQLGGLLRIYTDADFWRIGLLAALVQASGMALLGLWSGPWLRDVAGLDRAAIGVHLSVAAAAFGLGGIAFGVLSDRLARAGVPAERTFLAGSALTVLALVPIALGSAGAPMLMWSTYVACAASGTLAYPLLTSAFPTEMTGRVLTGINMLTMTCSFAFQAGIGAMIGLWPVSGGHYALAGYQSALALLIGLQCAALCWAAAHAMRRAGRKAPGQSSQPS